MNGYRNHSDIWVGYQPIFMSVNVLHGAAGLHVEMAVKTFKVKFNRNGDRCKETS